MTNCGEASYSPFSSTHLRIPAKQNEIGCTDKIKFNAYKLKINFSNLLLSLLEIIWKFDVSEPLSLLT